jgi:hypothetical protein
VGFVDAEGQAADKLYFNGNLMAERDNVLTLLRQCAVYARWRRLDLHAQPFGGGAAVPAFPI